MKSSHFGKTALTVAALAACMAAPVQALDWQGATFSMLALDADTLQLTMDNVLTGGTGNWSNVNFINAFEIKGFGDGYDASSANVVAFNGSGGAAAWGENVSNNLANASCTSNGNQKGACFFGSSGAVALTDHLTWTIDFTGVPDLTTLSALHLKVNFFETASQTTATGSLLSQSITTAVPEPETYALMLAGLGAIGFMARRRRQA